MKTAYHINERYRDKLTDLAMILADKGVPTDAKLIFEGRNKVYKLLWKGLNVNIKDFKIPGFPNDYVYTTLRKSKARRSFENAEEILKRGIPTPAPLAWIETKKDGKLNKSYYVSIQSSYPNNLRCWEKWDRKEAYEVLGAYAEFMLRIHRAGILHRDLSPGNVLWERDDKTGAIRFQIIDLNRMKLYAKPLGKRQSFSNFRNINLVEEETKRLAEIYGRLAGIDITEASEKALKTLRDDRKRKHNLKKLKNLFKKERPVSRGTSS